MTRYCYLIFILIQFVSLSELAQGCSDAGICTLLSFQPKKESVLNDSKHALKTGIVFGAGELGVVAIDPFIGYNLIFKKYQLETRFTYGIHTGNNISVNGFGDAFITNSFQLSEKVSLSAGVKFPLEFNQKTNTHEDLPMAYQPSLGTLDIIAGGTLRLSKLQFALALQQPVKTLNENFFSPDSMSSDSNLIQFTDTRGLDRKGDLFMRMSRPISVNDRLTFTPGLLRIYHVDNDQYKQSTGSYVDIEGSAGLTINASFFVDYRIKENGIFSANLGFPLLVRKSRPDGLTRSFVIGIAYTFSF